MKTPVLLIAFNRPDLAQQVFAMIRGAKPTRLFIAVDGPRADREGDRDLCRQCRQLAQQVDWDCEVQTLFREKNLGCKHAVSSAITWFFDQVEEGIILEDDTLPVASFFPFCVELLKKYRHEPRIGAISGDNFQDPERWIADSYYFSIYNHVWGWASWRRAWSHYDITLTDWPKLRNSRRLRQWLGSRAVTRHWTHTFDCCYRNEIDTWDYQWTYSCWTKGMLSILPGCNLVSNIGFGAGSTHTLSERDANARMLTREISGPLRHPRSIRRNRTADQYTNEEHYGIEPDHPLVRRIAREITVRLSRKFDIAKSQTRDKA